MKPSTTLQVYQDAALEAEFSAFHNQLSNYALQQARADALADRPTCAEDYQLLAGNHIHAQTQDFIYHVAGKLQTLSSMRASRQAAEASTRKKTHLYPKLTDFDIAIPVAQTSVKELRPHRAAFITNAFMKIGIGIMGVAEGALAFSAFRNVGLPKYAAAIGSGSIALAIYLGCEFTAPWIKKAKTTSERFMRYCAVTAFYVAGFLALAFMRTKAYSNTASGYDADMPLSIPTNCVAPALFVLSTLLFLIGIIGAVKTHRSKEERYQYFRYRQACKELSELKQSRSELANDIAAIEQQSGDNQLLATKQHEYAMALYQRCIGAAHKAKDRYITTNIRSRGGEVPTFFSQLPDMQFSFFANNQTAQR